MHCKLLATILSRKANNKVNNHLVNNKVRELLITYGKPHKPVSSGSVGRWIKNELTNAGVDTTVFRPHSYGLASVSKAKSDLCSNISYIGKRVLEEGEYIFKMLL